MNTAKETTPEFTPQTVAMFTQAFNLAMARSDGTRDSMFNQVAAVAQWAENRHPGVGALWAEWAAQHMATAVVTAMRADVAVTA